MGLEYRIEDSIFRYLDTDGDGTGTINANGNYSSTADRFFISSIGRPMVLHRMIVQIRDAPNQSADEYGNLNVALSNGIDVNVRNASDTVVLDLTSGEPITTNAEWGRLAYDVTPVVFGAGDDFVQVRWTFSRSGRPLNIPRDYNFGVDLNDDLSGLTSHTFMVQGYYEN